MHTKERTTNKQPNPRKNIKLHSVHPYPIQYQNTTHSLIKKETRPDTELSKKKETPVPIIPLYNHQRSHGNRSTFSRQDLIMAGTLKRL